MAIWRLGPEYHTVCLNGVVRRTLELGGEHTKARPSLRPRWLSGARPLWLRGRAHAAAGVGDEELRGVQRETNAINAKLTRVTPDGQMYIEASQTQTEANRVIECMKQRANPPR